jgi:GNAT superfamily N-acetyltransferase
LRPHQAIDQLALPDDDETSTGTFAAIDEHEEVVGTVRVAPAIPPFPLGTDVPVNGATWQLRGMATREDARTVGIGTALLDQVVRHVADHGAGVIWCNARVPAIGFYRRGGFVAQGDVCEEPEIGPHVVMWRLV